MIKTMLISWFTEEGQEAEPPHIECGHKGNQQREDKKDRVMQSRGNNFIFGPEPGKREYPCNRKRRNHKGCRRRFHLGI